MAQRDFDVDQFLARPLTARLATTGPSVRPVWYWWQEELFWILTGPWSRVPEEVLADPRVALVVDTCDLTTGECLQVVARGQGELVQYDRERGLRMFERYLGSDQLTWDGRFRHSLSEEQEARWLRVAPTWLTAKNLSFAVTPVGGSG